MDQICPTWLRQGSICTTFRYLRKFKISTPLQNTFLSATVGSVLSRSITPWYGNRCSQDQKYIWWSGVQSISPGLNRLTYRTSTSGGAGPWQAGSWNIFISPATAFCSLGKGSALSRLWKNRHCTLYCDIWNLNTNNTSTILNAALCVCCISISLLLYQYSHACKKWIAQIFNQCCLNNPGGHNISIWFCGRWKIQSSLGFLHYKLPTSFYLILMLT